MPLQAASTFNQTSVIAYKWPDFLLMDEFQVRANEQIPQYGIVAQITAESVTDVQTLTNTGTGGTFTLQFGGSPSFVIPPLNAISLTAAQLQAALQALPNIGPGGCTVAGTPFSSGAGSLVITFAGQLASNYQPLLIVNTGLVTGGSVSAAHTTVGVLQNAICNYNGALIANPTTAPALTVTGTDGTWAVGAYTVAYTYVTAGGESIPSYESSIAVASTNHIAVASITSIPAGVLSVNVYVNGLFALNKSVTSNATGAFSILGPASATAATPPPYASSAYLYGDGSQNPIGIANYGLAAAPNGQVTLGPALTASGNDFQVIDYQGNVVIRGYIMAATVNAASPLDQHAIDRLGKLKNGSLSDLTNAYLDIN